MPPKRSLTVSPGRRALAWIYTGPIGHLWSTLADIAVLWVRWGWGRYSSKR